MPHHESESKSVGTLPDPAELVNRQLARDKTNTAWKPGLLDRKNGRMRVSPFAFLRGTAPMYYDFLAACPALAKGPEGEGWLVGDMHIENFGAFRHAAPHDDGPEVCFNLNDFDDAVIGPWYLDVLRVTTSILLAARESGIQGPESLVIGRSLLDGYRATMASGHLPKTPKLVTELVDKVASRPRTQLLNSRTKVVGKKRKFIRGERYDDLPPEMSRGIEKAMDDYTPADGGPRPPADHLEVLDAAFRIAGTGSLGCRRASVLTTGKGGEDGVWVFDIKEEGEPSASILIGPNDMKPNLRVVTGSRACLLRPQHMLGTTTLAGRPMIMRRLMPQEDKLDSASLEPKEFTDMAPYFGALAAQGHTRGATKAPKHPWTADEAEAILANAAILAGWHEAAYLSYSLSLAPR